MPLNEAESDKLTKFLSAYATMRKYQKSFFGGNKAALKTAMFWENQTDNYAKLVEADFKIKIDTSKGQASQGTIL